MKKIELLAPAGDFEKLKIAIAYGADSVYFGGDYFGLRASAKNFSTEHICEAVTYVHSKGKKAYFTTNIVAHNGDLKVFETYLKKLAEVEFDGFIVSDPGMIRMIKKHRPEAVIHLSTQANTTNYETANFWYELGVKRLVLARELSLAEITDMRKQVPADLELEAFVHGAMCMSYSGRCLLSNYMTNRGANQGMCSQPCRWKYSLVEEKRPGEYIDVFEDEDGTYFFNSKDLCMIEHIPELIESGLDSLKIEGRMKSIYYVAVVVNMYRKAIDAYYADKANYTYNPEWRKELEKASHRHFDTGFYFTKPTEESQNYETNSYSQQYDFLGIVRDYDPETRRAFMEQRNKLVLGDEVEIFGPQGCFTQVIKAMWNEAGESIEAAPHAQQLFYLEVDQPVEENHMIRKEKRD